MQIQDQLNRTLELPQTPQRIVSLVPSQTELLVDLGLEKNLVGITKFCVHPENLRLEVPIVGGTKKVDFEKVKAANPDIILCNKEENTLEMVDELEKIAPVHVSDVKTLEDSYKMMEQYGVIFSVEKEAFKIIHKIKDELQYFEEFISTKPVRRVAYFIWKDPWMVVGGNTFVSHMLNLNNLENVYESTERYPEIALEDLPPLDLVLLSSEPYPFKEEHKRYFEKILPSEKILLVDGEYFSWYGSRLIKAFSYFEKLW